MAYCPNCKDDRPIERQTFELGCPHCPMPHDIPHHADCRGPVAGALDVCTYCNGALFAKINNSEDYRIACAREDAIEPTVIPWPGIIIFIVVFLGVIIFFAETG
jgi:hypothetical protein